MHTALWYATVQAMWLQLSDYLAEGAFKHNAFTLKFIMFYYTFLVLVLTSALSAGEPEVEELIALSCHSRNVTISLDDTVHLSDIVLQGHVSNSRLGEFGLFTATVSYSYAFKHDGQLARNSWSKTDIINFPFDPTEPEYDGNAVFCLIREQNMDLALYCMSSLKTLRNNNALRFGKVGDVLHHIRELGKKDNIKNANQEQQFPSPCDENGCSSQGSQCSVRNTLGNQTVRCTCISGYLGDGNNCQAQTAEAELAFCDKCGLYERCVNVTKSSDTNEDKRWNIECSCSHFNCLLEPLPHQKICGSDGHTYSSLCHLRQASCVSQKYIYLLHKGKCQENVINPCHGLALPLNTSTGLVTCKKQQCPRSYFCHSTGTYSICCPVSASPTTPPMIVTTPTREGSGDDYDDTEGSGDDGMNDDEDTVS